MLYIRFIGFYSIILDLDHLFIIFNSLIIISKLITRILSKKIMNKNLVK